MYRKTHRICFARTGFYSIRRRPANAALYTYTYIHPEHDGYLILFSIHKMHTHTHTHARSSDLYIIRTRRGRVRCEERRKKKEKKRICTSNRSCGTDCCAKDPNIFSRRGPIMSRERYIHLASLPSRDKYTARVFIITRTRSGVAYEYAKNNNICIRHKEPNGPLKTITSDRDPEGRVTNRRRPIVRRPWVVSVRTTRVVPHALSYDSVLRRVGRFASSGSGKRPRTVPNPSAATAGRESVRYGVSARTQYD